MIQVNNAILSLLLKIEKSGAKEDNTATEMKKTNEMKRKQQASL